MTNIDRISPEEADRAVHAALTLFIGRGREFSVEDLHAATGIPVSTIGKWLTPDAIQRRRPKACHILLLAQLIGVRFLNKLYAPIGMGGRDLEPESGSPADVTAKLVVGAAEFAMRAVDGRFCHVDRGKLAPHAADMIEILTPFAEGQAT